MQVNINSSLQPPQQSDFVQGCVSLLSKNNRIVLEIAMQKEILQHSHTLFMGSDEVVTCLKHKKLETKHISFYMKFLYDRYKPSSHSFLCPSRLGAIRDKKGNIVQPKDDKFDMRAIYLTSSICQPNVVQRVWLAPYNGGNHWMLGMINPQLARVYWLDPLRGAPPPDFIKMCTTALNIFHTKVLKAKLSSTISWIRIKTCPLQRDFVLSGLFICRMMRDIIQKGAKDIPESYFLGSVDSYTPEQINEIIEEWLEHLDPHLQMAI